MEEPAVQEVIKETVSGEIEVEDVDNVDTVSIVEETVDIDTIKKPRKRKPKATQVGLELDDEVKEEIPTKTPKRTPKN